MKPWKSPKASLAQMYKPPSHGNREESSLITSAEGTKKNTAAIIHKLIEEGPLCAAAAIQRGPSTVAKLNSRTSQNPISLHNCLMGSAEPFMAWLTESRPAQESIRLAFESF